MQHKPCLTKCALSHIISNINNINVNALYLEPFINSLKRLTHVQIKFECNVTNFVIFGDNKFSLSIVGLQSGEAQQFGFRNVQESCI